ncbi:MAG: SDR family NAD(P)-dependent oxidoreductase [Phycisphaerales bacterium]|nr:SDR family NAD(P)-dependent oxidoreductase [Phycisphaerales bacterium]
MKLDFAHRHVVVTGGTGALGTAVVGLLLDLGANCAIPVHADDELERFPFDGDEHVALVRGIDLTDEAGVQRLYASATGAGPLWASIHVAGGFSMGPMRDTSKEQFVAQMQQNALTCFLCCREAVRAMNAVGGRIVNVAARPALEPRLGAGMVPYTASKGAVAAITQALAEEVAGDDILVNAVVPSIMDTPGNRMAMPKADFTRWARVDDVAATIAFLASPQNTCTRGGLVPVYEKS